MPKCLNCGNIEIFQVSVSEFIDNVTLRYTSEGTELSQDEWGLSKMKLKFKKCLQCDSDEIYCLEDECNYGVVNVDPTDIKEVELESKVNNDNVVKFNNENYSD